MKRIISTSAAPAAVGPYSQGVEASGATLYVSGQLPIDPADGTMPDTVEQQTEQALRNVEAILGNRHAPMRKRDGHSTKIRETGRASQKACPQT